MDHPSPARALSALSSSVVSVGRTAGLVAAAAAHRLRLLKRAGARSSPASAPGAPGAFEALEGRRMLSSVTLSNGVLSVVGDANANNELVVQPSGSSNLFAYANSARKTVAKSQVRSVRFVGGSSDDDVFLASSLSIPSDVKTYGGKDEIRLANGIDTVDAGDGDDMIWTRGGDDKILGGNGNDTFKGDEGNDTFDGGAGNDVAEGEEGNDVLRGGDGADKLFGGPGNDNLDGGAGSDSLDGGSGTNIVLIKSEDNGGSVGSGPGSVQGGATGTGGSTSTTGSVIDYSKSESVTAGRFIDSSTPRPVINLIGTVGVGPHAVHVQALASTLGAGTYITARYQWDFGDPNGRFNQLDGWNAAHLYEKPGTYRITLTITNENGRKNAVSTTVTVKSDDRRTIYVDSVAGKDTNSGLSSSTPVRTLSRLEKLVGSNTRILFKRGQSYSFDHSLSLPYQNVFVGSYGSGADPVLWRVKGQSGSTISTYDNSKQVVISGLTFDSPYRPGGNSAPMISVDGVNPRGTDITVEGCTFLNLDNAVVAENSPRGLLVLDNKAPLATGLRMYFVWSQGSDQVFLGNQVANSTRQHVIRSSGTVRMLVAHNDLTNLDRSNVDSGDASKGVVEVHKGAFAYVADNELHDGALRAGPRGGGQEDSDTSTDWVVFENNLLTDHDIAIYPGTHHLMVRNNVVRTNSSAAITVQPTDSEGRTVTDIQLLNNTGVTTAQTGKFLLVTGDLKTPQITLMNNMWVAPNIIASTRGTAPVYVADTDLSAFKRISNNVWPAPAKFDAYGQGGIHYVWPYWSDARGYQTAAEWDRFGVVSGESYNNSPLDGDLRPRSGTVASDAGVAVKGVFTDMFGRSRPGSGGSWSAGALQTA